MENNLCQLLRDNAPKAWREFESSILKEFGETHHFRKLPFKMQLGVFLEYLDGKKNFLSPTILLSNAFNLSLIHSGGVHELLNVKRGSDRLHVYKVGIEYVFMKLEKQYDNNPQQ